MRIRARRPPPCWPARLAAPLLAGCGGLGTAHEQPTVVASFYPLAFVAEQVAGDHERVLDLTHPGMEPHDLELTVAPDRRRGRRRRGGLRERRAAGRRRRGRRRTAPSTSSTRPTTPTCTARTTRTSGSTRCGWRGRRRRSARRWPRPTRRTPPTTAATRPRSTAGCTPSTATSAPAWPTAAAHDRGQPRRVRLPRPPLRPRRGRRSTGCPRTPSPPPPTCAELHDLIQRDGITTVFTEELASPVLADTLAHDLGIRAAVLDPVEGLGDGRPPTRTTSRSCGATSPRSGRRTTVD